jgi:hypothetical protein
MEIRPVHGWETVDQNAPTGRGTRGGSEPGWASHDHHNPHHCVLGGPHGPPLGLGGGAPWREADSEAEDGGGAATSERAGEDEGAVEAGGWWPRVSSSRVRASRTCRKVGGDC